MNYLTAIDKATNLAKQNNQTYHIIEVSEDHYTVCDDSSLLDYIEEPCRHVEPCGCIVYHGSFITDYCQSHKGE